MIKTILITGATDGIGRLTASMLVEQGHEVLLHGRSANKLGRAAQELGGLATYKSDLSCLAETREMAAALRADHPNLDVLINCHIPGGSMAVS